MFLFLYVGNINLIHLASDELYKKRICMTHFTNVNTKKLKKLAVPQMYKNDPLKVKTPTKTYKNHSFFSSSPRTPLFKNNRPNPSGSIQVTPQKSLNILPSCSTTNDIDEIYIPTPTNKSRKTSPKTPELTPKTIRILDSSRHFPSPNLKSPRKILFRKKEQSNDKFIIKCKNTIEKQKSLLKNKRG